MLDLIVIVYSSIVALIIGGLIGGLLYKSKLRQQDIYTAIELEKERQDRGELESTLRQTQQEVAQLSHEKEQLSGALTQESRYRKTLERKLAFSGTSGYPTLLNGLYSAKRLRTDIQKRAYLQKLQGAARALWHEYQSSDISPDYSKIDYQEAYLLCYFLPYSQPVPYLLNQLVLKKEFPYRLPETGVLTATFFGCGPGPELLGLMRYLRSFQASLRISAAMLDREPWEHGRRIVFQHLLDRAWDPEGYDIREFKVDIVGSSEDFLPDDSEEWVKRSDLIVIQHCLNERQNATSERSMENMKHLVEKMKTGGVMLIIERATYVKELLGKFCYILEKEFKGRIHVSGKINRVEKITPILEVIPEELETHFLRELRSNAINSVEFIWIAVSKL